jgi:acetoin utilization deacetylase AcuC-like enzyme
VISAGFDAHAEDPVGDLGLEVEDFDILTKEVVSVATTHSQGRIVSVLEGGYNVPILAGSVAAHLNALGADPGRDQAGRSGNSGLRALPGIADESESDDPDGI